MECAPLPNVHISSSVSFYCENKSRCSCPFWMALCKRRHGGIPYRNRHFPLILTIALTLATPVLCQLCLAPDGDLGHFSDPTQETCSRNGTWISCALTTGPSPSSLSTFKNNNLLQSFPIHNICSKYSPFLMYLISCSVATDRSRAFLTPCKVALNSFGFFLFSTACYPFLLPSPLYKYFDFPTT